MSRLVAKGAEKVHSKPPQKPPHVSPKGSMPLTKSVSAKRAELPAADAEMRDWQWQWPALFWRKGERLRDMPLVDSVVVRGEAEQAGGVAHWLFTNTDGQIRNRLVDKDTRPHSKQGYEVAGRRAALGGGAAAALGGRAEASGSGHTVALEEAWGMWGRCRVRSFTNGKDGARRMCADFVLEASFLESLKKQRDAFSHEDLAADTKVQGDLQKLAALAAGNVLQMCPLPPSEDGSHPPRGGTSFTDFFCVYRRSEGAHNSHSVSYSWFRSVGDNDSHGHPKSPTKNIRSMNASLNSRMAHLASKLAVRVGSLLGCKVISMTTDFLLSPAGTLLVQGVRDLLTTQTLPRPRPPDMRRQLLECALGPGTVFKDSQRCLRSRSCHAAAALCPYQPVLLQGALPDLPPTLRGRPRGATQPLNTRFYSNNIGAKHRAVLSTPPLTTSKTRNTSFDSFYSHTGPTECLGDPLIAHCYGDFCASRIRYPPAIQGLGDTNVATTTTHPHGARAGGETVSAMWLDMARSLREKGLLHHEEVISCMEPQAAAAADTPAALPPAKPIHPFYGPASWLLEARKYHKLVDWLGSRGFRLWPLKRGSPFELTRVQVMEKARQLIRETDEARQGLEISKTPGEALMYVGRLRPDYYYQVVPLCHTCYCVYTVVHDALQTVRRTGREKTQPTILQSLEQENQTQILANAEVCEREVYSLESKFNIYGKNKATAQYQDDDDEDDAYLLYTTELPSPREYEVLAVNGEE